MNTDALKITAEIEDRLWQAADRLRAIGKRNAKNL